MDGYHVKRLFCLAAALLLCLQFPVHAQAAADIEWFDSDAGQFRFRISRPQKEAIYLQDSSIPLKISIEGEVAEPEMFVCIAHRGVAYEDLKRSKTAVFPQTSFYPEGNMMRADLDILYITPGYYTLWVAYQDAGTGHKAVGSVDIAIQARTTNVGWDNAGKYRYYLLDRQVVKNRWLMMGGVWYAFDVTGIMLCSEWAELNGSWFYFNEKGIMSTNWRKVENKTYYFGYSGKMRTGWQQIKEGTYYFGEDGILRTGKQEIDGKTYVFNDDGELIEGEAPEIETE